MSTAACGPLFYWARKLSTKVIGKREGIIVKINADDGKTCKQRGEWAELCFMARATDRGFNVSRPHGDSASYDVGVEDNGRFTRIQVKSTTFRRKGSFTCNIVGPKRQRYASGKLDFFAVYLVPIDVWYIIPFEIVEGNLSLNLTAAKRAGVFPVHGGMEFAAREGFNVSAGRCGRVNVISVLSPP